MKTEKVKLTQVKTNAANPRSITGDKFNRLVDSILVFPKMLELRPIVHDGKMTALGGNQRRQALVAISKLTPEQVATRLASLDDYRKKSEGERKQLIEWWGKWLADPYAYVINASTLTEDERKQFIIKDNVSFGTWDYDVLANSWDNQKLGDWGMDVWNTAPQAYQPLQPAATNQPARQDTPPAPSEDDGAGTVAGAEIPGIENLPPELAGHDLSPDALPKIEGDDKTATERIIIVYRPEQKETLEGIIGIGIDKVVYRLDEILNPTKKEEEKAAED